MLTLRALDAVDHLEVVFAESVLSSLAFAVLMLLLLGNQ